MSPRAFPHLFKPITIGTMTVKNRIAMAPMGTSFWTEDGLCTGRATAYYGARARGGAGMVIVENASVDYYRGMHGNNRLMVDSDIAIPGMAELSGAIKRGGAKAVLQLNHTGRVAGSRFGGFQPVAPSPVPLTERPVRPGETPRSLTIDEIHEIVQLFARAAVRAKKAGFDAVEVHAAHYYLIPQFLSSFSNHRTDQYGGSIENRARFLVEILTAIRGAVGKDYPFWFRINGEEFGVEGALTAAESQAVVGMVSGLLNAVSVTAYGYHRESLKFYTDTPGGLLSIAAAIKKVSPVPVLAVGRLTPEAAEQGIREGQADIAIMGRQIIADPDLPRKVRSGHRADVRPCIGCFICTDMRQAKDGSLSCSVNAAAGRERELRIKPAKMPRRVVIIGGGPAGMEAARVLALRGHKPVILEKECRLGGQLNLALVSPHKGDRIAPLVDWFTAQVEKLNVDVRLGTVADHDTVRRLKPDAVIMATGALPMVPKIPGIEGRNVVTAFDLLAGRVDTGKKVVIIGGGLIGCETAEFLYEKGKQVTVVEMLREVASDMGPNDRFRMLNRLQDLPIKFITGQKCCGVNDDGVTARDTSCEQMIPADTVVLAVGTRPNNSLFPALRSAGFDVRMVGDCWHLGRIAQAVYDGARLGCLL